MKYKVGDYVRMGVDRFLYYKIIKINPISKKYVLRRCIKNGKRFIVPQAFLERSTSTFKKVSEAEVILFEKP